MLCEPCRHAAASRVGHVYAIDELRVLVQDHIRTVLQTPEQRSSCVVQVSRLTDYGYESQLASEKYVFCELPPAVNPSRPLVASCPISHRAHNELMSSWGGVSQLSEASSTDRHIISWSVSAVPPLLLHSLHAARECMGIARILRTLTCRVGPGSPLCEHGCWLLLARSS